MIRIYTDGSTSKNGRPGAQGGIGAYFTKDHKEIYSLSEQYDYNSEITNNTCELYAILRVFEIIIDNDYHKIYSEIDLYSDSKYSVNALTEWIQSWKMNNWYSSSGKPVKNKELIQEIDHLYSKIKYHCNLRLIHTSNFGHRIPKKDSTDYIHIGNYTADALATNGRKLNDT